MVLPSRITIQHRPVDRKHRRRGIAQRAFEQCRRTRNADVAQIGADREPRPPTRWQVMHSPFPSNTARPRAASPTLTEALVSNHGANVRDDAGEFGRGRA
jgi:hypothetical protein